MPSLCRTLQTVPPACPVLAPADAASRPELERFISLRFAEAYGAHLYSFLPQLFGLYRTDGTLMAAFGLRCAADQPLFLERYLDEPIEALVASLAGTPIPRRQIVEVGNLAGASGGALRELIPLLCEYLCAQGYRWIVFTGSARLVNSFSRLGLPLTVIAPAPVDRLSPEERRRWGSYYQQSPSVMVGDLVNGRRQLLNQSGQGDALAALAEVGAP